jgi:hypothetical protein
MFQLCARIESREYLPEFRSARVAAFGMEYYVSESLHPTAPHHLPGFITAPGDTDTLMVVVGIVLIGAVLAVGN